MLKIPAFVPVSNGFYTCFAKDEFKQYSLDTDEVVFKPLNDDYTVTLNGQPIAVRECRVSAYPFNRPWPGKQRPFKQSESAGFISFESDEAVEFRVKKSTPFTSAKVRPSSKNITPVIEGDEIVFALTEKGGYVLEVDGMHHALHIFFNGIREEAKPEDVTIYYGPGIHFPGNINLRDNDIVYIHPEAIVFGSLTTTGAKNVRVFGGGVIDGSQEERITEHCYENHTKGNVRLYNAENISIEDIILVNSASWCLALFDCDGINIDNVKIVGQWRYNTDGIDICNTSNVLIKNCFIRSFDDSITLKGIYDCQKPMHNIKADNCVIWCSWGNTCEVGIETWVTEIFDVEFSNIDVIHTAGPALAVMNGCNAKIHDITYRNINVEFCKDQLPMKHQKREYQDYDPEGTPGYQILFDAGNQQYPVRTKNAESHVRTAPMPLGVINGVHLENINAITDDESIRPAMRVFCHGGRENIQNLTFKNLYLNGVKQDELSKFSLQIHGGDAPIIVE